jgi:hypothetical protein
MNTVGQRLQARVHAEDESGHREGHFGQHAILSMITVSDNSKPGNVKISKNQRLRQYIDLYV